MIHKMLGTLNQRPKLHVVMESTTAVDFC